MLTENLSCSKSPGRINYCNFPVPAWWTHGTMMAPCPQGRDSTLTEVSLGRGLSQRWGQCRGPRVHSNAMCLSCWVCFSGKVWKQAIVMPLPPQIRQKSFLIPTLELQKAFADRLRNPDWFQWVTRVLWKELEMRHVRNCQYYKNILNTFTDHILLLANIQCLHWYMFLSMC